MDGGFVCDVCGAEFLPEEGTYIGSRDGSQGCDPFMALVGNWQQLCAECNSVVDTKQQ